jgi:hypothetical protein
MVAERLAIAPQLQNNTWRMVHTSEEEEGREEEGKRGKEEGMVKLTLEGVQGRDPFGRVVREGEAWGGDARSLEGCQSPQQHQPQQHQLL